VAQASALRLLRVGTVDLQIDRVGTEWQALGATVEACAEQDDLLELVFTRGRDEGVVDEARPGEGRRNRTAYGSSKSRVPFGPAGPVDSRARNSAMYSAVELATGLLLLENE
jgi:hypothetical protein